MSQSTCTATFLADRTQGSRSADTSNWRAGPNRVGTVEILRDRPGDRWFLFLLLLLLMSSLIKVVLGNSLWLFLFEVNGKYFSLSALSLTNMFLCLLYCTKKSLCFFLYENNLLYPYFIR